MMMITLKFAVRDLIALHRELSPTRTPKWPGRDRVQIAYKASDVDHVQHAVCHMVERDSSAL